MQQRVSVRPRSGAQLAADVVERVIATGGEPYLEVRAKDMSWWQLSLLDVKLLLAVVVLLVLALLGALLYAVFCGLAVYGRHAWSFITVQPKQKLW